MTATENPQLKMAADYLKNDQPGRAKRIAERVLSANPGLPEALKFLAEVELYRGQYHAALPILKEALKTLDKDADLWARLGFCLRLVRDEDSALEAFKNGNKYDSAQFQSLFGMASIYIGKGDMKKAQPLLEAAIKAPSQNLEGYRLLATLTDKGKDKKFLDQMLKLDGHVDDYPAIEQAHLELAIATVYKNLGDHAKFMAHTHAANKLLQQDAPAWSEANQLTLDLSREIFTKERLKTKAAKKVQKFTPIFIVGLPRSGSTLLEQILASHTDVYGADEMPYLRAIFVEDMSRHYGSIYPKFVPEITEEDRENLALAYQDKVLKAAEPSPYIIDKMLGNSFFIGMIKMIMPWSKVIHIKRHPADTALSMYSSYFAPSVSYANNLSELAKYFRMHVDYMNHWDKVFPGFVHHLKYEDLVKNVETEAKKVVQFCGLDWQPECLEFHKTDRTVRTLSAGQVRSEIYASSISRWEKFADDLKPFTDNIQDRLKDYGY